MLETIREYALERLRLEDDARAARLRHVHHFAVQSSELLRGFLTTSTSEWLALIDSERDNLREALQLLLRDGDADKEIVGYGISVATDLGRFWWERGTLREGLEWLEAALTRTANAPTALAARCELQTGSC